MNCIFHTTRLITNDKWIMQRLFEAFCNLINRGYPVKICRKLMHKFSRLSQMDLLYPSRNNYNLKQLRESMTLRQNPYDIYRASRLSNHTARSRWNNHENTRKRKNYFNPNHFLWIIKYHPGAPNYDLILNQVFKIWARDPDIVGELGVFKRDEFQVR
eukprot:778859_1